MLDKVTGINKILKDHFIFENNDTLKIKFSTNFTFLIPNEC